MKYKVPSPGSSLTWPWLLSFIVLALGTLWVILTTQRPAAEIPFGFFVEQVRAGNVTQVNWSNDELRGSFARAIQWSSESDAPTADADAIYPPGTYSHFRTQVPRELSDAQLMSLLAQHEVQAVNAPLPKPWIIVWLRIGLPIALMLVVAAWILRLSALQSIALRNRSHQS